MQLNCKKDCDWFNLITWAGEGNWLCVQVPLKSLVWGNWDRTSRFVCFSLNKMRRTILSSSEIHTLKSDYFCIFTARVLSTTGRLCFDTCLSVCHSGGGGSRSSQWRGGSGPAGGWGGGQVQPVGGSGPASQGGSGPAKGGSGPARGGSTSGGGSAKIGQHREYLLHGGRYASCVHAGGLSCYICIWNQIHVPKGKLTGLNLNQKMRKWYKYVESKCFQSDQH